MADDYRRLYPTFWTSDLRETLAGDHAAVVVWLHLLASDTSSSIGLYRVRLPRLAADCYLSGAEEAAAKIGVVAKASGGAVLWDPVSRTVWLRNAARRQHGPIANKADNRLKGGDLVDEMRFAAQSPFWSQFWEEYREYLALDLFGHAPPFEGGPPPPSDPDPHPLPTHTHTHTHIATTARAPASAPARTHERERAQEQPVVVVAENDKRPAHPLAGMRTRPVALPALEDWGDLPRPARCEAVLWVDAASGPPETVERARTLARIAEATQGRYLAAVERAAGIVGDVTDTVIRAVVMADELGVAVDADGAWCAETLERRMGVLVDWAADDEAWHRTSKPSALYARGGVYLFGDRWGATTSTGAPVGTEARLAETLAKAREWASR